MNVTGPHENPLSLETWNDTAEYLADQLRGCVGSACRQRDGASGCADRAEDVQPSAQVSARGGD
jgi:hypothetical protein